MMQGHVVIQNKLGLHARPSAQFVALARQFACDIQVQRLDIIVNGKSLMAILTLAASQGTLLTIITKGQHEQEALQALCALVNSGFGEAL
ncbi:MAG: HPr family phosphocarrier protein [Ghiorsea sp.]|nr:HPr family phosphocarrier protein [Ghiorsea sp.]